MIASRTTSNTRSILDVHPLASFQLAVAGGVGAASGSHRRGPSMGATRDAKHLSCSGVYIGCIWGG